MQSRTSSSCSGTSQEDLPSNLLTSSKRVQPVSALKYLSPEETNELQQARLFVLQRVRLEARPNVQRRLCKKEVQKGLVMQGRGRVQFLGGSSHHLNLLQHCLPEL